MKRILLFAIFVSLLIQSYGQRITGTVYDKVDQAVVPFARVFFEGSTVSVLTDRKGDFQLTLPGGQMLPVVTVFPGCEPMSLLDYPKNAHIHFFINKKIYALGTSLNSRKTRSDRKSRDENLEIFREQFLGSSINAASCRILNERDLVFKYDPRTTTLQVSTVNPLFIVNRALGYEITYYLEKFEFTVRSKSLICKGYLHFHELQLSEAELVAAEKKRRLAYFGSQMEFFRSLWNNVLDSAGYDVRSMTNEPLTYDSLVIEGSGSKFWKYIKPVNIYHFSKSKSTTIQANDTIYFDRLGFYDTQGVSWTKSGEMNFQRLGDQLPFDYNVSGKKISINP